MSLWAWAAAVLAYGHPWLAAKAEEGQNVMQIVMLGSSLARVILQMSCGSLGLFEMQPGQVGLCHLAQAVLLRSRWRDLVLIHVDFFANCVLKT